jgi:hypothetical protein
MAAVLTLKNTGIEESPNGVGDILVIDLDGLDYDTGMLETPVRRAVLPDDGISGKGAQVISATQDADRYLIGNVMDYNRGLSTLEIARDAKGKITGAKMAAINLNQPSEQIHIDRLDIQRAKRRAGGEAVGSIGD